MVILSIIVPVYNTEKYLRDCLDSTLRQGFAEDEYEVICIDDCSLDNSYDILCEYALKYSQIRAFRNKENLGVSVTRNNGLRKSCGEYVTFLDSDDMVADGAYSRVVNELMRGECTIANWNYGCHIGSSFHSLIPDVTFERCTASSLINKVGMACMLMVKKQAILENSIEFAPNVSYAEDALFCYLLLLSQRENEILKTNERLYFYRIVDGSLSKENQDTPMWFRKLSDNMKELAIWLTNYLEIANRLLCIEQVLMIRQRISEYSARAVYNAVKAKRTDISSVIRDLTECNAYPYRIQDVISLAKWGGIKRDLKNIALNLAVVVLNNPLYITILSKLWGRRS